MTSDENLGKEERLLKSADFARVYKKGLSFKKNSFILASLRNGLARNRLGFSISSRNIKLAHTRNRIRRLFKEAYRKKKSELKTGFDIVLIVKKEPGKTFAYKEADNVLMQLAETAGLLA